MVKLKSKKGLFEEIELKSKNVVDTQGVTNNIIRYANEDDLLYEFAELMQRRNVTVEWRNHPSCLEASGYYDERIRLAYRLEEDIRQTYGNRIGRFSSEVSISSPDESVITNGIKDYVYGVYIPGNNFSRPVNDLPQYAKKYSVIINGIKNQLGLGIDGWTLRINRRIGVSLKRVPDEQVRKLVRYFH